MPHPGDEWLAGEFPEPDQVAADFSSATTDQILAGELGSGDEMTSDEEEVDA